MCRAHPVQRSGSLLLASREVSLDRLGLLALGRDLGGLVLRGAARALERMPDGSEEVVDGAIDVAVSPVGFDTFGTELDRDELVAADRPAEGLDPLEVLEHVVEHLLFCIHDSDAVTVAVDALIETESDLCIRTNPCRKGDSSTRRYFVTSCVSQSPHLSVVGNRKPTV